MSKSTVIIILIMLAMILWSAWFHDAFGQVSAKEDTSFIDDGVYKVHKGGNKYQLVIGDRDVYKKNGNVKRGKWKPEKELLGIFEEVIKEDMTTRVSKEAPTYRVSSGNDYVQFIYEDGKVASDSFKQQGNGWRWKLSDKTIFEVNTSRGRVKELITSYGRNTFNWTVDANNDFVVDSPRGIRSGALLIESPIATDKGGKVLDAGFNIAWTDKWTLTLTVDTAGAKFPIVIDPSVIDTTQYSAVNPIRSYDVNWIWARRGDGTKDAGSFGVGATYANPNRYYWRYFLKFPIDIPVASFDSAKLELSFTLDSSTVDFTIIVGSGQQISNNTADFNRFVGYTNENPHTGLKNLTEPFNTSSYAATMTKKFLPHGLDTLEAHNQDTMKIALVGSLYDSTNTASNGSGGAYVLVGTTRNLYIYYTVPVDTSQFILGRSLGGILHEAPGYELDPERNPGNIINEVYRKQ